MQTYKLFCLRIIQDHPGERGQNCPNLVNIIVYLSSDSLGLYGGVAQRHHSAWLDRPSRIPPRRAP